MDGMDLRRRIGWSRAEAKAQAKFAPLRRTQYGSASATAADCVRMAKQPLRRLEALRRRASTA